jgi:hypothetical protein
MSISEESNNSSLIKHINNVNLSEDNEDATSDDIEIQQNKVIVLCL